MQLFAILSSLSDRSLQSSGEANTPYLAVICALTNQVCGITLQPLGQGPVSRLVLCKPSTSLDIITQGILSCQGITTASNPAEGTDLSREPASVPSDGSVSPGSRS